MGGGSEGQRLQLRRIGRDEWELWRDVRLRALAEAPDAFGSTLAYWQGEDLEKRWRSRLNDVPLNVVATAGGSAIGQVSGSEVDADGRVELTSMWVDPAARGTGVGEALVASVVEWARSTGAAAVVLSVKLANVHAVALYQRAGFEPIDELARDGEMRMQVTLR